MIETILYCLPQAYKGTIYRIGGPPDLTATRVTSGFIDEAREAISWGLPESSEYNPPGRPWLDYRDEPSRPLEAMGWCVERQKSWTAEDPLTDSRSVRLQVDGVWEDYHHMEPVLVRKVDLNQNIYSFQDYPLTWNGKSIWTDSDYVVVAVIKIHFRPRTIYIDTYETKVIKKLSRALGTELLSYQFRKDSMEAMQALANDRLKACNILADSLRNAITKSGLIFSLVKQEIGFLRDQWEEILLNSRHEVNGKREAVRQLNALLTGMEEVREALRNDLIKVQNRFLELSLPPDAGEKWVSMQIEERWEEVFSEAGAGQDRKAEVRAVIARLKKSLRYGREPEIIQSYNNLPESLKKEWVELLYQQHSSFDSGILERLIRILNNPGLEIPSRERSRKNLVQLKALAETMNNLERNTNFLLRQVLNGKNGSKAAGSINELSAGQPVETAGCMIQPEPEEKDARL
ncbi:MAG: hypothetical protein ACQET7_15265 [Thermodesulfobacteriota bacterium]